MKVKNEANKDKIIEEFGEDFYNILEKTANDMNKIFRDSNCKNNDFAKRMYEERDKLREQEEKDKK